MESFKQDLTFAFRQLAQNLGFTVAVVLMLGLGIGANTAVFSVANKVLLQAIPFKDSDRVVHVRYGKPSMEFDPILFSVPEFYDYQKQAQTFSGLMEYHSMSFALIGRGDPDRVQTGVVSSNAFEILGVRPILGRTFRADDERPNAPPVLILSNAYWKRRIGGDTGILGQTLRMNGKPITVVGILPPLPQYPYSDDVYMTTSSCPFRSAVAAATSRAARQVSMFGRLKPGVSVQRAQTEIDTIQDRLRREYPTFAADANAKITVAPVELEMVGQFRTTLLVLLGTVILVLLLTCANVGILFSVRLLSRQKEVVLRAALGAGRGRLIRQLLTEGILLSCIGGALGLLLATFGTRPLSVYAQRFTPLAEGIGIDGSVLTFTLLLSLLTGLIFGLVPALQVSRRDLVSGLKQGGHATLGANRHRIRNTLIIGQVAISFVLLIAAGLAIRSALEMQKVDPGFKADHVLSLSINMPFTKYPTGVEIANFYRELYQRLGTLPGVVSAGSANSVPLTGGGFTPTLQIEGHPTPPNQPAPRADLPVANRTYFKTLGIPVLRGRTFLETDNSQAPLVAIANESAAKHFWPGEDPIGKRFKVGATAKKWVTVVGLVGNVRQGGLTTPPGDALYFALRQVGGIDMSVFVRTKGDPLAMVPAIRRVVHDIDAEQPIADIESLEQVRDRTSAPLRVTATLLGLFAFLAFAIMITGISWAIAFSVTERRQEISIRAALGAQQRDVLNMVFRQGAFLIVVGLAIGIALALAGSRILSGILFGVAPTDPTTYVIVATALLVISGVACLVPARRAMGIDPILVLRS
jgi:predicted permease